MLADTTADLRDALALLEHAERIEQYHAPRTGLHTIAPRLYQIKAARVAVEQALRFPSTTTKGDDTK